MLHHRIENLNIKAEERLITPDNLKAQYPLSENAINTVERGQQTVKNILDGSDKRLFVVVGPCSIHDTKAAREYATRLKRLANELQDTLFLIMRIYFEKPRTTVGWQGLIIDPYLDGSFKIEEGLKMARSLLLDVGDMGLPAAGEALDIVTPQYIQDLISWTAIGARTTESQSHRKMASGFTSAVGFKNGTDGNIDIALNAMTAASADQNFVSINPEGQVAVIRTTGNPYTHIILRGGHTPNYDASSIQECEEKLLANKIKPNIIVDCSHANSSKNPDNQTLVLEDIANQICAGNRSIKGLMLESNLNWGKQKITPIENLEYGVSVTDACIDWETTENALRNLGEKVKVALKER